MTSGVRVRWVGVGLRWTVPRENVGSGVKRERIVLVFDVVVVKVVGKVGTANSEVAEVVRGLRTTHVNVEPVVNAVVVLVKRTQKVIVKIVVVVDFTIDVAVQVAVFTGDFEIHGGRTADGHLSVGCSAGDGQDVARRISGSGPVDGDAGDHATAGDDVEREAGAAAGGRGGGDVVGVDVAAAAVGEGDARGAAVLEAGVIAGLVAVGIDFNAGVRNAVVVVVRVNHVEDAVVVVVGVGRVRRAVVVVVGVEEVRRTIAVKVAVNDGGERRRPLGTKRLEAGSGGPGSIDSVSLPVNEINAARIGAVFVERPRASSVVEGSRRRHLGGDGGVVGVSVRFVGNTVAVIVRIEVVGRAVRIKVAGPGELVNSAVVIVVLVVASWASTVAVLIGHTVVVVVHRVLVCEVEVADSSTGPRMDG